MAGPFWTALSNDGRKAVLQNDAGFVTDLLQTHRAARGRTEPNQGNLWIIFRKILSGLINRLTTVTSQRFYGTPKNYT